MASAFSASQWTPLLHPFFTSISIVTACVHISQTLPADLLSARFVGNKSPAWQQIQNRHILYELLRIRSGSLRTITNALEWNLRVVIKQLRKKIEKDPTRPRYILTEPRLYRFQLPIVASEEPPR